MDPRGAGCHYAAADNVKASDGDKGTLAIWQWPLWRHDLNDLFWRLEVNSSNYMRQFEGRTFRVCSAGVTWDVSVSRFTSVFAWDHMVYTWDFSVPDGGQLRAYWNGASVGEPVTTANAPVGSPARLTLGAFLGTETRGMHMVYSLAVWDDVMTAEHVAALYEEGHRYRVSERDGTGALTLLATFDGRYDADIAAGDGTFGVDGVDDRYCLVDDGAREQGRRKFLIGWPRHDLSEDDRVPLCVPCPVTLDYGRDAFVADTNESNYGELGVIAGYDSDRRVGAGLASQPIFEANGLQAPGTLRQRMHLPNDENPTGRYIRVGPVDYLHYPTEATDVFDQWGSGRRFTVVSDAGNSPSQFKTDLDERYETDYWNGADVTLLSGNCAGRRLKAQDYDDETKVLVLESALPETPTSGSVGVVDHRARLEGCRSWGSTTHGARLPELNMDAWLWEFHAGQRLFTELEWQYFAANSGELNVPNLLRYDRGRSVLMDGASHSIYDNGATYGKPSKWEDNTLYCKILLERIELDGPGTYQVLMRDAHGVGPSLGDNFMLRRAGGDSTKVWRKRDVERCQTRPTKISSPSEVRDDLRVSGTWRDDICDLPIPVHYDEEQEAVTALLVGTGTDGVARLGYVEGRWDTDTGRIRWEDEEPPQGRANPFMEASELRPSKEADGQLNGSWPGSVIQRSDGRWSLVYVAQAAHPDHYLCYLLEGAEDRWSFSRQAQWWPGNPISPILGGPDRLAPEANGFGVWANRDADWKIIENPYACDESRRYWGIARGKSVNHRGLNHAADLRPLIGLRGSDLRSLVPLPHGNCVSPLVGPLVHACEGAVLGQADCLGLYTDTAIAFTSGVYCYVSEDAVHFQSFALDTEWLPQGELPGEPTRLYPGRPFRLGDKRIYYYHSGSFTNFGWTRLDGEAWYELSSGESEGFLETPVIVRPDEGWGDLIANVAPEDGAVAVAVLDGDTDDVLMSYSADDFDAAGDSVEHVAQWNGVGLGSVSAGTIRLRFTLSTDEPAGEVPKVYSWRIEQPGAISPPRAVGLRVEGQVDPTNVVDPTPDLSWDYEDDNGLPQTAYHVIVASTKEHLEAHNGDVWDTGEVESSDAKVTFGGSTLESETMYYWRVRVRNSEGAWSEEW